MESTIAMLSARDKSIVPLDVVVTLLGEFSVSVNGVLIDASRWRHKHPRLLFQMLCLAPGHRVSRDEAAEALWPQAGVQASSNRLYHALHVLRATLEDAGVTDARQLVQLQGGTLQIDASARMVLDCERFRQAVTRARACNASDTALAHMEKARTIHRGALSLPADAGDWFAPHQHALQRDRVWVLEELVQRYRAAGRSDEAVLACQELVRAEPGNEAAHRVLIELHDAQGRSDLALQQYTACRHYLRRELGAPPSPATRRLAERIVARAGAQSTGAVEGDARPRYAAPRRHTPLLGREAELEALQRALRNESGARLITIVAAGGMGKTRLAAALAEEVQDHFADGVCFVTLGEVQRPSLLAERVCQALGLSASTQSADDALTSSLAQQHRLLVLDRCEHLTDIALQLASWLRAAPRLRIVATSQCVLRSRAEEVYELPPLSARAPQAAVGLFASAARLAGVDVDMPHDEGAIRDVCERVGGNALAIELAGASLPRVPLAAMPAALEAPLRMLAGASPDGESRHASLQATIAWSVSLLAPTQARLLALLSVFAMPFRAEDAQTVLAAAFDEASVHQGLRTLLERHLLSSNIDPAEAGIKRFAMSDGVREFSRASAAADPDRPRVEAAHAAHFVALVQRAWAWTEKGDLTRVRPTFVSAAADIDAALQWVLEHGDVETYLQRCWQYGQMQICFAAVRACIELMRGAVKLPVRSDAARYHSARCNNLLGVALEHAADLRASMKAALKARRLARGLDDDDLDCRTAVRLARLYLLQRRVAPALALIDRTLSSSHARERLPRQRFLLHWVQGHCFEARGQYAQAVEATERALDCAYDLQHGVLIVHMLETLAYIAVEHGNLIQADRALDEVRLLSSVQLPSMEACNLAVISGMLAFERCSFVQASRHFDDALRTFQTGVPSMTLTARLWCEFTLIETGKASDITVLSNLSETELARADHLTITGIHARACRVALQAEQGRWADARLSIGHLHDYVRPTGNARWASVLMESAATAALCIGERMWAQRLFGVAQRLQAQVGMAPTPRRAAGWVRLQARLNDAPDRVVSAESAALMALLVQLSHDVPRECGLADDAANSLLVPIEHELQSSPIAA